ncbi:MAG: DUF1559 domain-containing protein [Armatimonadetes bacterium]|nr:DUF1559 domain-containing protein [Armatimonadota bacterium]
MKNRRGFTLIELLVVIAIIAILAAILFPVFARARAMARKTSCLSNLKNINMGMQMYTQDYDERFPFWNWGNRAATPSSTFWAPAIMPYVKNTSVFQCPDDVLEWNTPADWTRDVVDGGAGDPFRTPAGCNFWDRCNPKFNSYAYSEPLVWKGKIATVTNVAGTVMVGEGAIPLIDPWADQIGKVVARAAFAAQREGCCMMWGTLNNGSSGWFTPQEWINSYGQAKCDDSTRHNPGANMTYVDGHAKFIRWQDMTADKMNPNN